MEICAESSASETEKAINRASKVLSAIDCAQEGIFITDSNGKIEYTNQYFLTLNNLSDNDTLGKSIADLPHSENISQNIRKTIQEKNTWTSRHQIENSQLTIDETKLIWINTRLEPITNNNNEVTGFIGIQRNVSKDVIQEQRVKKEMGQVMSLAIKQGKDLEELKKSKAKALQQVVTKSEFLANMSHEIRTPMNGVLGMTELLMNTDLNNKQQHLTNTIHRSGRTLLSLINDILDLSKIEAGKLELKDTSQNLRLLIEDIASTFAERANRKGLELTCIYPAKEDSFFFCDKERITQIISNLIGNALKFTEEGEVAIKVIVENAELDEQAIIKFEITDTGAGIPERDLASIFESFSQVALNPEHSAKGTGLGLAICKQLSLLMGGEIGVDSEQGKGSTFWFTALLKKDHARENLNSLGEKGHVLKGMKVLIVDDNATNRENMLNLLQNWDIEVSTTADSEEGIAMLESAQKDSKPYSVAMLDNDMPHVSGVNLAKLLKQKGMLINTRLILLNNIADLEETTIWTTAGIKSYLTKPVRQSELFNCLVATVSLPARSPEINSQEKTQPQVIEQFNAKILVVEDNTVNQELVIHLLEEHGCNVVLAQDGQKAIDALRDEKLERFDLVLMDCQMPVLDGYAATVEIRKELKGKFHLPIIALTANAMEGDKQRCIDAGMDDYLTKPFSRQQLTNVLKKWISHTITKSRVIEKNTEDKTKKTITDKGFSKNTEKNPEQPIKADKQPEKLNTNTLDNIRSLQREGAPDILEKIIGLFHSNSKKLFDDIKLSVQEKDAGMLCSAAHSLKSSSANLGADQLASVCQSMETMGKTGELNNIDETFSLLKIEYEDACKALNEEIS